MSTVLMGLCCPICQDAAPAARDCMAAYGALVPGAQVCGQCAERIANAYNMRHGGKWLTWPNEPAPARRKAVIPAALRTEVFERDLYRCRQCATHLYLTVDHIVAEANGGPTVIENLQTLCRPCNSRKGARP